MATTTASVNVLKKTFQEFSNDKCPQMAAALAYYTIISLAPLMVLLVMILSLVLDPKDVQGRVGEQLATVVGQDGAEQVQSITARGEPKGQHGILATVISVVVLVFGATGVMAQLQSSLNEAWEVEPDPQQGGIKNFLLKRVLSMAMILTIAFLLLVSLAASMALQAFGNMVGGWLPGEVSKTVLMALNFAISFAVVTFLFAAMFKVLPDAKVAWRDVWIGAVATALLFVVGKFLIGMYLGRQNLEGTYGAAGSLVLVLIWIYYSAMIFFLGAEFTQVWAQRFGQRIEPKEGAVRIEERKERVDPSHDQAAPAPRRGESYQPTATA